MTNGQNLKKKKYFLLEGGGGGGGGRVMAGGWVNIMYKRLKWHFYSSRNTNVPSYSEIHAKIRRNGPDKLNL